MCDTLPAECTIIIIIIIIIISIRGRRTKYGGGARQ